MVEKTKPVARRSFLSRAGAGVALAGAGLAASLPARAQDARGAFQPARHAEDDWLDQPRGGHRLLIDSTTAEGAGSAFLYAGNFFVANKNGYNLDPPALAVAVVLRHFSTPFGYNDAMWAKYGAIFSEVTGFTDPKTKAFPAANLYNSGDYGFSLPNSGTTLASLIEKNVQFAVCAMGTRFLSRAIAGKGNGDADAVYRELTANLIPNSHMVAAGIVALSRAQERGYSFAYAE